MDKNIQLQNKQKTVNLYPKTKSTIVEMIDGVNVENAITQIKESINEKASVNHRHDASEIDNLIVNGNVDLSNYYDKTQTNDKLNEKANIDHTHTDINENIDRISSEMIKIGDFIGNIEEIEPDLNGKINVITGEIEGLKTGKSDIAHNHSYNDLLNKPDIPRNISQLINDTNFATETFVTNKISEAQLSGDGNVNLSGYATKDDLNSKADIVHNHDYNDLTNKPNIPTKMSQLNNDSNFANKQYVDDKFSAVQTLKGEKGDRGEQGVQGVQGEKGEKGDAFRYEDFTPEQLLSLKGDKGDRGEQGVQGIQGNDGNNGRDGIDGKDIEIKNNGTHIQWKYINEGITSWRNLVEINTLKGEKGDRGNDGANGKQIELTKTSTHIKWRYAGQATGVGWTSLIAIEDLKGEVTNVHEHNNLNVLQDLKYKFWCGSQAEYDEITNKDENTFYFIKEYVFKMPDK